MTRSSIIGVRVCVLVPCLAALVGCTSSLRIDVAVYKGPVSGNRRARLETALGLARANSVVASLIKGKARSRLVADLTAQYNELDLSKATAGAPPSADSAAVRTWEYTVASKLRTYNENCQSVVRGLGFAEIAKTPLLRLFGLSDDDLDYLAALITIDENTRLIDDLLGAARSAGTRDGDGRNGVGANAAAGAQEGGAKDVDDDEVFLRDISSIMDSQSPGALMLAVRETLPFWYRTKIDRIYNGVYWGEINPIEATGMGDYMAMLVKDDIGNWHLKKVEVDPTEIIKTAAKLAELALKAAAP